MPYRDPEAQREYQRRWMAERRAAALEGKTCARCGDADGPFDFHHVDPAEKLTHNVWSWSAKRREAELAKCVVLCRDCHVDHHGELRRQVAERRNPCGTYAAYKRGCKCAACTAANAAYEAERRQAA